MDPEDLADVVEMAVRKAVEPLHAGMIGFLRAHTELREVNEELLRRQEEHLAELDSLRQAVTSLASRSGQPITAVPVRTACELLGCKKSRAYELMACGRLVRAPQMGRTTLVTRESIEKLLAGGKRRRPRRAPDAAAPAAKAHKDANCATPEELEAAMLRLPLPA